MNYVFMIASPFRVPDTTLVSPFLNPKDSMSGLPFDLLDGFSLAARIIEPNQKSKIQVLPFVTQVTFIRTGRLEVRMKGPSDPAPYLLKLVADQAVLTEPGVFLQLINNSNKPCEVLYIISPAYLFDKIGDQINYDDSVVFDEDWDELSMAGWQSSKPMPSMIQRKETEQRLASARHENSHPH